MYESLTIYSYKNASDSEQEYQRRLNSPATIHTNLTIKPFSQQKQIRLSDEFSLFYLVTPQIMKLLEEILNNSKNIVLSTNKLSDQMIDYLTLAQLINEIKSTNDIEGVKSTKKEINAAIQAQNTDQTVRFKRTVSMYFNVLNSKKLTISNLQDFRSIYDEVVSEEIEEVNQPDGILFRKASVEVLDQRNNKVVHRGNPTENGIQEDLLKLIAFMNENDHVYLIKAIVTHYFFEYIHPFYDGNGRVGRFILTSYMVNKLDVFSALSVSEAIFNQRKRYEDAFIEASSLRNRGDLTPFIIDLFKIILSGQKNIIKEVKQVEYRMTNVEIFIKKSGFSKNQKQVLYIILQMHLFDIPRSEIENQEISQILKHKLSRKKIDQSLKELEDMGYVKKVKSKPISYSLNEDAIPLFD